jgi:hypothetical protein
MGGGGQNDRHPAPVSTHKPTVRSQYQYFPTNEAVPNSREVILNV